MNHTRMVSIPQSSSLTTIGDYAFEGCTGLTELTFGENVSTIEYGAFGGCTGLTELTLSGNITTIGSSAFGGCTGLTELTLGENIETIDSGAFSECTGLQRILYNAKNAEIAMSNYYYDDAVFSNAGTAGPGITVIFGESVEKIPVNLFYTEDASRIPKIVSVTVGSNVNSIGDGAFMNCSALMKLVIPANVAEVGWNAFEGCTGIKSAGPIGGDYDFEYGWTDVIPTYPFNNFTALESVVFPDTVTEIQDSAFSDDNLELAFYEGSLDQWQNVVIGFGNTSLVNVKFRYYPNALSLPATLKEVNDEAFAGIDAQQVIIPATAEIIGSKAFAECENLQIIVISNPSLSIASDAFVDSPSVVIYAPAAGTVQEYAQTAGIPFIAAH